MVGSSILSHEEIIISWRNSSLNTVRRLQQYMYAGQCIITPHLVLGLLLKTTVLPNKGKQSGYRDSLKNKLERSVSTMHHAAFKCTKSVFLSPQVLSKLFLGNNNKYQARLGQCLRFSMRPNNTHYQGCKTL